MSKPNDKKENLKKTKKKFVLKFPWWCKIIAYIISFVFACVSLFFVIIKGLTLGNEKVTKWLTSLIISFFSSMLLTQPIQIALLTFVFVAIFRSADDKYDLDSDDDDDEKNINLNAKHAVVPNEKENVCNKNNIN